MDVNAQYGYDDDEKCGKIHIADKTILVDIHDLFQIINYPKGFIHYDKDSSFPYFWSNKQKISYLEFLYAYTQDESKYVFKNRNPLDIRRQNIDIVHHKHDEIMKKYDVIKYTKGHYVTSGKDARKMKNPLWYVRNSLGNTSILMYCERDTIVELCELAYEKICKFEENSDKKITFFLYKNGYVAGRCKNNTQLYIHQIISGCYGNGKGTTKVSVDHIDRNPLNNRCDNLRIVENEIQQKNRKGILKGTKRARKQSARTLPDGITQDMLEKYVVYYHECYNKEKQLYREFFKVEKHPKLDKIWITSKSNKISVQEKLKKANQVVLDLEKGIYPGTKSENENENENASIFKSLPKYVSFRVVRNKPCLIFEKRILEDGEKKRFSLKYSFQTYPKTKDELSMPLRELGQKVKTKYNIEL